MFPHGSYIKLFRSEIFAAKRDVDLVRLDPTWAKDLRNELLSYLYMGQLQI